MGEIETRAIGHYFLPFEIYLSEKDSGFLTGLPRTADFFYRNKVIANEYIYRAWKKYINIAPALIIKHPYLFLIKNNPKTRHLVPFRTWRLYRPWQLRDIHNSLPNSKIHFEFSQDELNFAEGELKKLGLSNGDQYIAFFARDPQFHGGSSTRPSFRDSDITTQIDAMEEMVKLGYKCIRMGKNARNRLGGESKNIIDYAFSPLRSDLLDLYILSKCKFMVSTGSGIDTIPMVFRKPVLYVNFSEWGHMDCVGINQVPLFIPKKFFYVSNKKYLSTTEICKLGVYQYSSEKEYIDNDVWWEDNTSQEIMDAVLEMELLVGKNNSKCHTGYSENQENFSQLVNSLRSPELVIEAKISHAFLNANPHYLR
ncbi:TIGR04372 family glycosyltransferase [Polynucleobacter sp. UB-Tiil-W10]|nr:TIGR04372 family glycosyltransferase [Polynucleobacter sp. UB-Tiil-W10]